MGSSLSKVATRAAAVAVLSLLPAALGCGAFFVCQGKASCGASGSGTDTGNLVYAGNLGSTNLYAYYIGTGGTLGAVTNSPYTLTSPVSALAMTTDNSILYVAEQSGAVYSYVVSSAGVLTNATQQFALTEEVSMVVSPDGQWLILLDAGQTTNPMIRVYHILSGGTLASVSTQVLTPQNGNLLTSYQIAISHDGLYIAAALGSSGEAILPFATATGIVSAPSYLNAGSGENSVAFDGSDNLFVGRTTGVASTTGIVVDTYSSGLFTAGTTVYPTDAGPRSLVFKKNYASLYTANLNASTITANSVSAGVPTAIGTGVGAPASVQQLAIDTSQAYLLAAGINATTGLQIYTLTTSGSVSSVQTAVMGTSNGVPSLVVSH